MYIERELLLRAFCYTQWFLSVAKKGLVACARLLFKSSQAGIALTEAAGAGHIKMVRFLAAHGACKHTFGQRALRIAARNGDARIVDILLEDPAAHLEDVLLYAAGSGREAIVRLLIMYGANLHYHQEYALSLAAGSGHLGTVECLVDAGANVRARKSRAFRFAATWGHLAVVEYLARRGADIHAQWEDALRSAAEMGHLPIVQFLIHSGADIHAHQNYALRWAAKHGHLDIVQCLVQAGANMRDYGECALVWAAQNGYTETAAYLSALLQTGRAIRRTLQ